MKLIKIEMMCHFDTPSHSLKQACCVINRRP